MNKELILIVGPPGSGKSTYAQQYPNHVYINQDTQGKAEHLNFFNICLDNGQSIIVDRLNFNKQQRNRYLEPAKKNGYTTTIIVLHESFETCLNRCKARLNHPTIKDEVTALKAITMFFKSYERVEDNEGDKVIRIWPEGLKERVIVCDLDGTLCNIDHRLHFVKEKTGKDKDWKGFSEGIINDEVNDWCKHILKTSIHNVIYCSGRSEEYRNLTQKWLENNKLDFNNHLFMRLEGDYRKDSIVKEIILDFEIKTRYDIFYCIDDRKQVVDMWRKHGYVCLDCSGENF